MAARGAVRTMAAVDLGAESGRVMLARYDGRRLSLDEIHRFPNRPVMVRGHRLWNVLGLWDEMFTGLRQARQQAGALDSIGVDTWGVDYGLVNAQGLLRALPVHYRDHRTDGVMEQVFASVPREVIYARTGIQFLPINTLFQLYAHESQQPGELGDAHRLLLIPDLLHSWLSGEMVSERTNATTTQCWDPIAGRWAIDLLDRLGIPTALLPPVVEPGTQLGETLPEWRSELGAACVIAPATHDTGAAIAATPIAQGDGWAYISSGTWSLIGAELTRPLMTPEALAGNWTNEGGVFGTTRFLKNVMGLWLLQECQRMWALEGRAQNYDSLRADRSGRSTLPGARAHARRDQRLRARARPAAARDARGFRTLHHGKPRAALLRGVTPTRTTDREHDRGRSYCRWGVAQRSAESMAGGCVWCPSHCWPEGGDRPRQCTHATGRLGRATVPGGGPHTRPMRVDARVCSSIRSPGHVGRGGRALRRVDRAPRSLNGLDQSGSARSC